MSKFCSIVAVVFIAMSIAAAPALAIPLMNGLPDNNTIIIGDKTFQFTGCTVNAVGSTGTTSCSQLTFGIMITGPGPNPDNLLTGFHIGGAMTAKGAGSTLTITIGYTVTVNIPDDFLIADAHLTMSGTNDTDNWVTEDVTKLNLTPEASLYVDGTAPTAASGTIDELAAAKVTEIINAVGTTDPLRGNIRHGMSGVSQQFSQVRNNHQQSVPEPATLALFGAGLAGLGALRRRRKAA